MAPQSRIRRYQHVFDADSYTLDIGAGFHVDLARHLKGQCVEVMAVADDGRYLWNFEIWNERIL